MDSYFERCYRIIIKNVSYHYCCQRIRHQGIWTILPTKSVAFLSTIWIPRRHESQNKERSVGGWWDTIVKNFRERPILDPRVGKPTNSAAYNSIICHILPFWTPTKFSFLLMIWRLFSYDHQIIYETNCENNSSFYF